MHITTYQTADDFLLKAQPTLLKNERINSLILGIARQVKTGAYLATIEDGQDLLVFACMTPPHNLILASEKTVNEDVFALLAQDLQTDRWPVSGVVGPVPLAENFARTWTTYRGQKYRVRLHQRLFALERVISPTRVPGTLRVATENDLDLMVQWMAAFFDEAMHGDGTDARQYAQERLREHNIYVWELPDGQVVSMAAKNRPLVHVISVGPVYTPPEYRGQGYASNCVAALSQHLLDSGWQSCCLFTDLANPTANSIYQKMGYRPISDFDQFSFEN